MSKINLLKFFDSIFGTLVCKLLPPNLRSSKPVRVARILIIRPGGIGDAVLLVPAIQLLHKQYPDAIIDILAEKRNSGIFALVTAVHSVFLYDRPKDFLSVLRKKYDVVIDSEQWHRLSAIFARLVGAPMSIGFATNERINSFTHSVPYSHDDHEIDSFLHLTSPIRKGAAENTTFPFLSIPHEVSERTNEFLRPLSKNKLVAIFPGGSILQKRWERDKFHKVARLLAEQMYGIVLIGGKAEAAYADEIVLDIPDAINCCGKLTLIETAAVLKETSFLITADSGIMHIAYGLGIKVLALFGPSNREKWAPRSAHSFIISKKIECSPCSKFGYTPRCKRNWECMKQITVEEVFDSAIKILET